MAIDLLVTAKLTFTTAAPLILAATAGFASERAGVINIALEGKMLGAAFACYAGAMAFGPMGGLACAIITGVVLSVLHWWMTQKFRVDPVISGMGVNLLAAGSTNFLLGVVGSNVLSGGQVLPLYFYYGLALVSPVIAFWVTNSTRAGLHHRAAGSDPDKARLLGLSPISIRFWALGVTGILCGLAGALLVTETNSFTDNMTSGRGYIALAALILGGWRPIPAFLACLLFGFASGLKIQLQGTVIGGFTVPSEAWTMLPYLVTLVALAGFLGQNRTPKGLGKL